MSIKLFLYVFLIFFLFFNFYHVSAQVTIDPMYLQIDKDAMNGMIDVINASNEAREVNLEFKFAYPKYDSLGKWELKYDDSVIASKYSLAPYLKMFPKRLVVPPNGSQTVRIMIKNLPEGGNLTYWTRIIATSEGIISQIDTIKNKSDSGKITPRILLNTKIIGLIVYHKGNVTSAVDFDEYRSYNDNFGLHLICKFQKAGTSPFLGAYILKVYDTNDNLLIEKNDKVTIYENSNVEYLMEATSLKHGKLKVELTVNNEKYEIPEELRIPFKPVTKTFYVDY